MGSRLALLAAALAGCRVLPVARACVHCERGAAAAVARHLRTSNISSLALLSRRPSRAIKPFKSAQLPTSI